MKLCIHRKTTVELVTGLSNKSHSKFFLEHNNRASEGRLVKQQLECEWRGDLVRDVCHTYIKIGKISLEDITLNDLYSKEISFY